MDQYDLFQHLHHQESPLLIGNVWDVISAKAFEEKRFKAIATSSAALARTMGYEDGEKIPFELLLTMVERIINNIHIPLSVDMEGGYSRNTDQIIQNIEKIYDLGAVGFNIEDSVKGEKTYMLAEDDFKKILSLIREVCERKNMKMFINARTDGYIVKLPDPLNETLKRARSYESAGASGIFVPFLFDKDEIKQVVAATKLPVNVFATPQLPGFDELSEIGIKRISMGTSVHGAMIRSVKNSIQNVLDDQSFKSLY
ncbi:MAG: isocitrate lyase/phosphoenolpyruvate mutase family protein [Ginsengibacter sp.]